jgi:hypothetical protein
VNVVVVGIFSQEERGGRRKEERGKRKGKDKKKRRADGGGLVVGVGVGLQQGQTGGRWWARVT